MAAAHIDDPNKFLKNLWPGDMLMCDTLHPVSRMIELAENRPVNHALIFVGDDTIIDCGFANRPQAVWAHRAGDYLQSRKIRTVTAFRHTAITKNKNLASKVIAVAKDAAQPGSEFGFEALARVMLPSLLRSYHDYAEEGQTKSIRTFRRMSSVAQVIADQILGSPDPGSSRLTCSAFVYRCFRLGGLEVEVTDPLAKWVERARRGIWGRRLEPTPAIKPHDALNARSLIHLGLFLAARRARKILKAHVNIGELGTPAEIGEPVDTLITPRDLWGSPSFIPVYFLHRPRLPGVDTDKALDED